MRIIEGVTKDKFRTNNGPHLSWSFSKNSDLMNYF